MDRNEMNHIIGLINTLNNNEQNIFYNLLRGNGFSEEDIFAVQSAVFYHKLFTDISFHHAVKNAICEQLKEEIYN